MDAMTFMETLKTTGEHLDSRLQLFELWSNYICTFSMRAVKFMKKVPGFRDLHPNDQSNMIKGK